MRRKCFCILIAVIVFISSRSVVAQTAQLTGQVTDPQKLAIANADVRIVDQATGVERRIKTNNTGYYVAPFLQPGQYKIFVQAPGFDTSVSDELTLTVEQTIALNFQMRIGSNQQQVTVDGGSQLINTNDASVSTVIDQKFVENLPLNGRSFQTLLLLTPGAVVTPTNTALQGQFSINGQRADANYFTVDGVSANNGAVSGSGLGQSAGGALPGLTVLGSTQSLVSADAMQEFRVQTSTFAPEFGRTPGGQISIVTRSGSNEWHGTASEYFRNDVLDANNWFADHNNIEKPKERQNDFGGVLGGPIWKDHTFFFFSYEGLRLRQPLTATTLVPSNTARALLPASVMPLVNLFPVSSSPDLGNGTAQLATSYSNPTSLDAYGIRIDHAISSKVTIFGRYSDNPSSSESRGDPLTAITDAEVRSRSLTLGSTQQLSANINNESHANYSNVRGGSTQSIDDFGGATPQDPASLFQSLNYPAAFTPQNALFALSLTSASATPEAGRNTVNEQRQVNLVDTVSIVTGAHNLKMGVDYRWLAPFTSPRNYLQSIAFSGVLGGVGTMQSGMAQSVNVNAPQSSALLINNFSLFAQDTWKPSSRLTLTYGLRWDVNPPFKSKNSNQPFYTVLGVNDPATMTLAPAGTPMYQTSWDNIAPRLGVTYALHQQAGRETILRAGFGDFYDLGSSYLAGQASNSSWPYIASKSFSNVAVPLTSVQAAAPQFTTTPPVSGTFYASVPDLKIPRTWEFNAAVEQALGDGQSLTITYVGALGRDMTYAYNLYHANASFPSVVNITTSLGTSNYNALQVQFQRRLSKGLQTLVQYTWSHSLDTGSDSTTGNPPLVASDVNADRGDSSFDIRNSFSSAVVYDVPSPSLRWAKPIFGGWSVSDFIIARTAPPVNVTAATVILSGYYFSPRPNVVTGQPFYLYGSQYPGNKIFNNAAFVAPPTGTQGDLQRDALRGFGAWQTDFSARRRFNLTERIGLQFSGELFNILNHPNFGQPTGTLSSALFGQSTAILATSLGSGGTSGGFSPLYQIGGPRSMQLALKLMF